MRLLRCLPPAALAAWLIAAAPAQQLHEELASDGTVIPAPPPPPPGDTLAMLHRNWTTRDGLPQDHIRAIARSRDGFLWLATDAGLARFDGFGFKTYGLRDGLRAVSVICLLEARDGTLWIGTTGGGLSAFRDGKVTKTYTQKEGLPSENVDSIAEDDEGGIWIMGGGGARLLGDRFLPLPAIPVASPKEGKPSISTLFTASDKTLWAGVSGRAVSKWSGGSWTESPDSPKSVVTFCEDREGRIWAADNGRNLWCHQADKWEKFAVPEAAPLAKVHSIAAGNDGTIWIAYFRAALLGLRSGKYFTPLTRGAAFADLSEQVHVTSDGQLWLGSATHGLYALTPSHLSVQLVENVQGNQAANFVGALAQGPAGTLLAGTQGRGFYMLADGRSAPLPVAAGSADSAFVNSMLRTRKGEIWAGGTSAVYRFLDGKMVAQAFGPKDPRIGNAWDLCEDPAGTLWAGTGDGALYQIKDGRSVRQKFDNTAYPVKGMACQSDGTLWVGTRGNGLFCKRDTKWPRYGEAQGLPSEVIRVVLSGADDTLWVGTAGGGLAVKQGERFSAVTTQHGLPDNTVSQIMEDNEGRLWLGTNRGLAVLSAKDVERIKQGQPGEVFPRVIDRFDGLLSEEFTIVPPVKTDDGRVAFATTQGVALLRTRDFHADETTPPVLLEEILLDNRAVAAKDGSLKVPPGVMRIDFHFTGLHFAAPDRLRFRTRLTGLEENWSTAGTERNAVYRNLEPGHYRFEVSASTGNGLWSEVPAVVDLTVRPHFWQTAWFRLLATVLVLGAVIAAVRQLERQRASRRIQQLERQQAVDNERARIARDLHDDVGASLTQVALLSQLARSSLAKRPERASQHVQEIFDTAKEVTRSLDEIVWAVNPANDTFESFALFLGAFVQNYSHTAGLRSRFDVPEALPALPLEASVRHHLYLATKEVMHNTVKHAKASEVRMTLALEPGKFHLVIEDNGQGYDSSAPGAPHADGLINLQNRLKQLGGTCTRHSSPGQGTSVEMTVPLEG
ncbi:two-component regulator propeller domain-containing protein [Luteolibacter sp. Populi]|uniref:sensor histidine kinase n=1 Tax=Luteolibacter sp. Populi TaxID=3230487 RepID=UPI0034676613